MPGFPAFFMRTHELSIEQAGIILGLGGALSGLVGAIVGGIAFDRLARNSMASAVKLIAWSQLVALPASILLYTAEHLVLATIFLVIPSMCAAFFRRAYFRSGTRPVASPHASSCRIDYYVVSQLSWTRARADTNRCTE